MALDSPKLQKVLEEIKNGVIQLPDFQREWKWDDQRIRELIATVTLDYPLGVVMTLETGGSSPFRARPLTGAEDAGTATPGLLLLDGQQRLTSLFQSLHLARPVGRSTTGTRNSGAGTTSTSSRPSAHPRTGTTPSFPYPKTACCARTSPEGWISSSAAPRWNAGPRTSR
ncbi:DUF262 domain-containing protein [Plantactinospora sp. KLBMP9567]|uniref:DUF262 domain-containing protein n=1 Tax=Plantactinospora sp. KLBMP9567 TaxID=3085900 RepID=UPI002981687B|nr:DUF262 domain-containing protein [Plantactinospora sp. KLBMP9567]MDW5330568.1 DUF262 domain-containing protein [Plantactinospora sp. KLBMP9567]